MSRPKSKTRRHSTRSTTIDLRWKAIGRWPYSL
ncbi:hypothetical protein SmJEL517_g03870 [Synchytrium microbalum]|uniref:Uncharacterized protein n=1 Tax=Synchytrium microbalum TaxID=1806994 RepID=A0A507BUR9_9FUNG|nr:uncharacterized protein SmJEL517_g03870 [Synchytrium microbalum]TPX33190.1 hypothetical protein SmJEL517_g03870 [Synchytrium microbalum]